MKCMRVYNDARYDKGSAFDACYDRNNVFGLKCFLNGGAH